MQNGRQIISLLIVEQVAHHEYQVVQTQITQAQKVDTFLHEKFNFAFDTARKAERTMKLDFKC